MKRSVGVSQLAVFLFFILLVQVSIILGNSHSKVMLFDEAWGRSLCSAMQRLVEVDQEYPGGVEHIYSPGCVPLLRCSGCCNDDKVACYPSRTHNTTIQLLRITPAHRIREYVLLSFQEHHTCECRPRRHPWRTRPTMRGEERGQRRRRRRRRRGGGTGH